MKNLLLYLKIFTMLFLLIITPIFAQETVPGTALDFDGIDDYINCGNDTSLSFGGTAPFTFEMWVKPHSNLSDGIFFSKINHGEEISEYKVGVTNGIVFFTREVAPWDIYATTVMQQDTWYHIAAVYNSSNMIIYINGNIENTLNSPGAITATIHDVLIGAQLHFGEPSGFYNGEIEEVRVWDDARTKEEIRENMHLTLTGTEPGLISYWQFNEGSGTTANDPISGNNGNLEDMDEADWVTSTVPVGGGTSFSQIVNTTGIFDFTDTGLSMDFTEKTGTDTVVVSKLDLGPNTYPSIALADTFNSQYWIVNKFGDGTLNTDISFTVSEEITSSDELTPYDLKLFERESNADSIWLLLATAEYANAAAHSATFAGITNFSQFVMGRKIELLVNRFSPNDDSTNVPLDANLLITFDRNVTAGSGNIIIMKTVNESIIETIPAANTIINDRIVTINPSDNFDMETGYYVLIDSNSFHDISNNYFAGIQDTGTWNFSTLDYFTDISAGLTGVMYSSVAWGDYDNDGDMDILLAGRYNTDNSISLIYRNDAGTFVGIEIGLIAISDGSVAWGDYDNDGDLDILLTGKDNSANNISKIYRNDSGEFTDISAGLTGVMFSSVAWGDYDNDGDLDILLTGQQNIQVPVIVIITPGYRTIKNPCQPGSDIGKNDTVIVVDS